MSAPSHRWRFFRAGGLDQVRLETGADVANLESLDPKLWVALACPVKGLEIDEKTLAAIDTDQDGRVRLAEVLDAVRFCREALVSLDGLVRGGDTLPLSALNPQTEIGKKLRGTAMRILEALGKPESDSVSLADVSDTAAVFAKTRFNGDGIVIPDSADDEGTKAVIGEVIAALDAETDRSGVPGISQAKIDAFFEQLTAFEAWWKRGEADAAALLPLGEGTAPAAAAVAAVQAKVDDFFARCRLAAFDPRSKDALNHDPAEYVAIGAKTLSAAGAEFADFPLAHVEPGRALPLGDGVNPAWRGAVEALASAAVAPILGAGRVDLTEADWAAIRAHLAAHVAWAAEKPATKVETLGIERVRALLASTAKADLTALVEKDASTAAEFEAIASLDKLVRLHRDLFRLLQNFVSFTDFYAPDRLAVFQAGTLFLDSRACELCVRVDDPAKHAALAGLSACYLAYCDCVRKGEKMQIAAVFSGGDRDYLMVGRNGVFYDRKNRDWDATITKVVENPISIREAFYAPYKKFVRFVEEQVTKRATAADTAATGKLAKAAEVPAAPDKATGKPAPAFDLSSIALIGVAVTGAAAVIGGLLEAFFGLGYWMPLGLAGLVLVISGPSMLIAALKLRQRNLGPLLEANGWAINSRVKVNIPFGGSLTRMPVFPEGSERSLVDPYQPRRSPWATLAWVALAIAVLAGGTTLAYHEGWVPASVQPTLSFLGVPGHLVAAKDAAQAAVTDAQAVLASATEQQAAAKKTVDDLLATEGADPVRLARAQLRLDRADTKLHRAQDRLDRYEARLERATDTLDAAVYAEEARLDAAEEAREAEEIEAARVEAERALAERAAEAVRLAEEKAAEEAVAPAEGTEAASPPAVP